MSQETEIKRIEQEIGWYKIIFAILVATNFSLLAWVVKNYSIVKPLLFFFGLLAIIILCIGIVLLNRKTFKLLDKLEGL